MKYITPYLETERLILKRGELEDYLKVYEFDFTRLRGINGEFEYIKCDPKVIEGFPSYADEEDNVLDFIMYEKTGAPVGNITLDRYNVEYKSLEISINIHPNYWGKGYAKETIIEIMKYVFDNLGIDNIIYTYALENAKSQKVSEKIGFVPFKRFTEHYSRIDKDVESEMCILSKESFYDLYKEQRKK